MSFYIVETKKQLQNLPNQQSCFIYIIPLNSSYHPILTTPSLIFYRGLESTKSHIICINHSESLNEIKFQEFIDFLQKHNEIFTLDLKRHLYYLPNALNIHDINYNRLIDITDFNTQTHNYYYSKHKWHEELEKIIPITKQYEKYENLYASLTQNDFTRNIVYNTTCSKIFNVLERTGIQLDKSRFFKHFEPTHESASIKDSVVYTNYNLYNTTTRPTNHFNGINFSALTKPSRVAFIPRNDIFIEFDYEGYHPRLIAREINYILDVKTPVYETLARMYNPEVAVLTADLIKTAKEYTFKQLYGGIEDRYIDIPYFAGINEWINDEWDRYKTDGFIILQGGKQINDPNLNRNQVFNYVIQSIETFNNVNILNRILPLLETTKSKLILYNYDSFLFDVSLDEKEVITTIKNIISEHFPIKINYGKNYKDMQRIQEF